MKIRLTILALMLLLAPAAHAQEATKDQSIPDDFVEISAIDPSIVKDIRYYTPHNFVGVRVDGYLAPKCYLTRQAAEALAKVQGELATLGLSLKVYDCYRPTRAVDHFVRWAQNIDDTKTRGEFYSTVDKRNLFKDGFIAKRSGHSRGSTVDLTIVPLPVPPQESYTPGQTLCDCFLPRDQRFKDNSLDMGTGFDCFHDFSHTANPNVGPQQRANRLLLKSLMEKNGFENYSKEWWHFSLKNEPHPDTYYNFEVK